MKLYAFRLVQRTKFSAIDAEDVWGPAMPLLLYLDDIVVFSSSVAHLEQLEVVLGQA